MPNSPDVRDFVDLTLYDASSQAIFEKALDYALIAFPELQPREGTIENLLLQAIALEVQEAIYAINRLPGAVVEVLLRLLDLDRNDGTKATAVARFTGLTASDFAIPVGTRLFYQANPDSEFLLLETTQAVTATQTKTIITIVDNGTDTITVTTATRHGLSAGDAVTITGTDGGDLDVTGPVDTVISGFGFTLDQTTGSSATDNSGTVTPDVTIPATGFASIRTTTLTDQFNGLLSGTQLKLLSVLVSVANVELETSLLGGILAETDPEYFNRASSTLARLSTSLTTNSQIEQFVVEGGRFPEAYRVHAIDDTDVTRVGSEAGHVMIAVAPIDATETNLLGGIGDGSLTVDDPGYGTKDVLYDGVSARTHVALVPVVVNPALVTLEIAASVRLPDGLTSSAVSSACESVLNQYISPNTWDWLQILRTNELIVQLRNTTITSGNVTRPAIDYVESVVITPTDVFVPVESEYNSFSISSIARSGGIVTVTTSDPHGINILAGETLYLKIMDVVTQTTFNTSVLVEASSASSNTFVYSQAGSNVSDTTGRIVALVKTDENGNLIVLDPAPLLISGTHTVTTITS
jgi:hypothetical protein